MNLLDLQYDQDFMRKLAESDDTNTVKELLASKGVEMTEDEIKQAFDLADKELSEEDLENVAGGLLPELYAGICILAFVIGVARGSRCK